LRAKTFADLISEDRLAGIRRVRLFGTEPFGCLPRTLPPKRVNREAG
jgi:hypothetical protein